MAIREVNDAGLALIKEFEGIRDGNRTTPNIDPYMDPVEIWTIGWGHAIRSGGRFLRGEADRSLCHALYPDGLSREQCEQLLRADLLGFCRDVSAALTVPTTDSQFAALVSFSYNLGVGALKSSTLLKYHNRSKFLEASEFFERWNKAGGKVLPGLTRRRLAEKKLYLGGS